MNATLAIAGLTIREAVRRRLLLAFASITVTVVGLSAWGFHELARSQNITSGEQQIAVAQALVLFMFMFSFVVALSASAIASPSIASEVESGVLLTVLTRPVRRAEVLVGKWLGLAALLACYAGVVSALEFWVVYLVSGFVPPDPAAVAAYLFAEGILFLTLALSLSTRLSVIASGVVAVAVFGISWLAGVVGAIGKSFGISALQSISRIDKYLLPTDGLWRGAIYYLEPSTFRDTQIGHGTGAAFVAIASPSWTYLVWVAFWFLLVFALGIISFRYRKM